jgi:hypothetical protein
MDSMLGEIFSNIGQSAGGIGGGAGLGNTGGRGGGGEEGGSRAQTVSLLSSPQVRFLKLYVQNWNIDGVVS